MRYKLPVAYDVTLIKRRSRDQRPQRMRACGLATFDIPEYDSRDVHHVADWRQSWGGSKVMPPPASLSGASWKDDLAISPGLARLALIDGTLYAPLRATDGGGYNEFTRPVSADEVADMVINRFDVCSIHDHRARQSWVDLGRSVCSAGGWVKGQIQEVDPVSPGDEVVRSDVDLAVRNLRANVKELVIVDGTVWVTVVPPCLVVRSQVTDAEVSVGRRVDYSDPLNEAYFPLSALEEALEYARALFPRSKPRVLVDDLTVMMPQALEQDMALSEISRSIKSILERGIPMLPLVSKETAGLWYDLRDELKVRRNRITSGNVDDTVEKLQDFLDAAKSESKLPKTFTPLLKFGSAAVERWTMRDIALSTSLRRSR